MAYSKQQVQEAREQLTEDLKNAKRNRSGQIRVYYIIRSVADSGMSRVVALYVIDEDGDLLGITWKAAQACEWLWVGNQHGFRITGCGMDMVFAACDTIARHVEIDGISTGNDFERVGL